MPSRRALSSTIVLASASLSLAQLPVQAKDRHEYDLLDVAWDISFDFAKGTVKGDVTNTLKTTKDGALLVFDRPKLTIDSVKVDGKTVAFEQNDTVMAVRVKGRAGRVMKVRVQYHGAPEAGIYFVPAKYAFPAKTPVVYTQGEMVDNRYWLPTYDWPDDKATSQGTVHLPKGWKALSNGQLRGVTHGKTEDVWRWRISRPHSTYLISLVAGPYDIVDDGHANVPVSTWVPQGLADWGKVTFGGTDKVIAFYNKLTGFDYPWEKYSQSAVPDFMFGGMENVTCTTQTIGALFPPSYVGFSDATGLVAHELAHQWFGDTVTCPDWPHAWINEGWASFLPSFWTREKEGEAAYTMARQGTLDGAASTSIFQSDRAMIHTKYKDPFDLFDGFAYGGGAARMFMLMHEVGEDKFWPAVKAYLNERKFENVTTEQFFASFSKSVGRDLDAFRRQWFYTKGAPSLTLVRNGQQTVVKQAKYPLAYPVPLDVLLVDHDGKVEKRSLHLTEDAAIDIPGADGRLVVLDPDCWLMARLDYDAGYTAEDWKLLYRVAPNDGCRDRLLNGPMAKALTSPDWVELARRERNPRLLRNMVGRIDNADIVLELTNHADKQVATTALGSLGRFKGNDAVRAKLERVWKSPDFPEYMKNSALQALFQIEPSDALADEAWAKPSQMLGYQGQALGYWTGKADDKARRLCLTLVTSDATAEPLRISALRALGHIKDKPGSREVYDTLVGYLKERSNSPLRTAINALADYGDPAAAPLIEAHRNHSLFFVRQDVERALNRLKR
ncbi:MAG: M1 family metallopeptidase [Fimbriimonadaceae bacterium]|nr:M1 family metallopeptidase [Fimbriimonadaceae bacterium]